MNRLRCIIYTIILLSSIRSSHSAGYVIDVQELASDNEIVGIDKIGLHEYHVNFFPKVRVATEYTAYRLLKNKLIEQINYLAIPWVVLIKKKQLNMVPNVKLQGGFTVCQHIRYKQILPILAKLGIDVLFTPHALEEEVYKGIKVLPFPHYSVNGVEPAAKKDLWYSFIGYNSHWTRKEIFKMPQRKDTIIKKRQKWFSQKNINRKKIRRLRKQELTEYRDVLSRSRFSLCPRGTGPSTIRFWESLQAGAIPVLIADAMTLPKGVNWDECIIKIPEKELHTINDALSSISHEQEQAMRDSCLQAYRLLCEGDNFVSTIRNHYETMHDNA